MHQGNPPVKSSCTCAVRAKMYGQKANKIAAAKAAGRLPLRKRVR